MVAIGKIYQKTYHPTQLYIGITSSGGQKEWLKNWWVSYILKYERRLKKTEVDYVNHYWLTSREKYL